MATRGRTEEVSLANSKPTDWLNTEEVAVLCGMTHSRVCQLLRSKLMKGEQGRGRIWRIQRREAEKFTTQPEGAGRPRRAG